MRKIRNRRKNNTKIMFIISFIFLFIISSGYATFATIIKLNAEGELIEPDVEEYVYAKNQNYLNIGNDASQIQDSDKIELSISQEQLYCSVPDENPDFSNASCFQSLEECSEYTQESPGEKWCPVEGTYSGCKDWFYFDTQAECETELQQNWGDGSTCENQRVPAIVCQNHTFYYEDNYNYIFIRYGEKALKIVSAEVGFLLDGEEHYMKGGDATYDSDSGEYNNDSLYYNDNKNMLLQTFGVNYCTITNEEESGSGGIMYSDKQYNNIIPLNNTNNRFKKLATSGTYEKIICTRDWINAEADTKGNAKTFVDFEGIEYCITESNGDSYCSDGTSSGGGIG